MEREANYAAVGAFVLLLIAMASLFVYWYSKGREHRDYQRYEIYFDGSVSGLTRGSTVRYLGVDVGRVVDLRIDKRAQARVQVVADIDTTAPVTESTVAELSLQGVTGLLYVDLVTKRPGMTLGSTVQSENEPVIPSIRSSFDVFVSSLPDVVAAAGQVAERVKRLLNDESIASVNSMLANLDQASRNLPATMREVAGLVTDLRGTALEVKQAAAGLRGVADEAGPNIKATLDRVRVVAENLANTSSRLDKLIADNQQDFRSFTRDSAPELERTLRDFRTAAQEFASLSRSLKDNPSQIVYEPAAAGVEIPR
jgi:phospholipid/cholesterol/gamma-HCH transport system substrate-binding protein